MCVHVYVHFVQRVTYAALYIEFKLLAGGGMCVYSVCIDIVCVLCVSCVYVYSAVYVQRVTYAALYIEFKLLAGGGM